MTNTYFLGWIPSQEGWVIDPGFSPEPLIDFLTAEDWQVSKILLTHAHLDHIAGIEGLRKIYPECDILIHHEERDFLTDPSLNLSTLAGRVMTAPAPTGTFADGDQFTLGDLTFSVIHTPGHSPGGSCFYQADEEICLSGDSLFYGSVGRTDFPTSDGAALSEAIRNKLFTLPDATVVHPGHGPSTSIGGEKKHNPFVRG